MKTLIILFSSILISPNAFSISGENIYKNSINSILYIETISINEKGEKGRSSGTGFFIEGNGLVFTNKHVIKNAISIKAKTAFEKNVRNRTFRL